MSWFSYAYAYVRTLGNPQLRFELMFIPQDFKRYQEALIQRYFTEDAAKRDMDDLKRDHYNLTVKREFRIYDREKQQMVNMDLNTLKGEFVVRQVYY